MTCPMVSQNSEMLVAYAAGELDMESVALLERHLADCPACRSVVADQAALWKALDAWEAPTVSTDFNRRLYRRIDTEARLPWWERLTRPFRPMPLRHALPLTASAALLLMAGFLLQHPAKIAPVEPRSPTVRADQVESTLEDLELLRQFGAVNSPESGHSDAM